ncbi:penicillin-binding protein activator [Thiogranum longum]
MLFAILMAVAACTTAPQRDQAPAEDTLKQSAQDYAAKGDYLAAAQLYLNASKSAPDNQRYGLLLSAADFLAAGQLWEQLAKVLAGVEPRALDSTETASYQLLSAELALANGNADQALALLQEISQPESLADGGQRYYQLRADAYVIAGNSLEAARQLIWADGLISDPDQKLKNQYRIWEQLSSLSDRSLQELQTAPPPDPLTGWMELILITRQSRLDQQQWNIELDRWRVRYPDHPAQASLLPDLVRQAGQAGARLNRIAVLLPLSGRTAEQAAAIRDGIMAAYYQDSAEQPELRFYDTAGNAQLLWSVYQQAVQDGAEFIIGPLLKESIEQLASSGHLPVPVLALNQTGSSQPIDLPLYQFGLAPEDEARQVAERMFYDGHREAIAMAPATSWGERVLTAFNDHFLALGGQLLEIGSYSVTSPDFKGPIESALNLDASKNRHRALEQLMGQKLSYEPRRRQDVEAIFLLGFPEQARQIRPQLRFFHAGDIPVYSTSHVFSAAANARLDRDMDGLMFCDLPWVLDSEGPWFAKRKEVESVWPNRTQRSQRLFALGFDAYRVAPWLETLNRPGFSNFAGATGQLTLDQSKQLHRTLVWAQFENGTPQKLLSKEGHHEPDEDWRER